MKKLILSLCVLGTTVMAANAQTKIGYININELVAVMPEAVKADKDLQDLQEMLQLKKAELTNKVVELDSLLTKTDTLPPKMTKAKLSLLKDETSTIPIIVSGTPLLLFFNPILLLFSFLIIATSAFCLFSD